MSPQCNGDTLGAQAYATVCLHVMHYFWIVMHIFCSWQDSLLLFGGESLLICGSCWALASDVVCDCRSLDWIDVQASTNYLRVSRAPPSLVRMIHLDQCRLGSEIEHSLILELFVTVWHLWFW